MAGQEDRRSQRRVRLAAKAHPCSLCALLSLRARPQLNVQNGVLKAMSFLFEYIGEMGKDYV